jgi:hypothetical protein
MWFSTVCQAFRNNFVFAMTEQRKQAPAADSTATTFDMRAARQRPASILGRLQQPTIASRIRSVRPPTDRELPSRVFAPLRFSLGTSPPGPIAAINFLAKGSRQLLWRTKKPFKQTANGAGCNLEGKECASCADRYALDHFPSLQGCKHAPAICQACIGGWIEHQLDNVAWDRIGCPSSGCRTIIPYAAVQEHASAAAFAR